MGLPERMILCSRSRSLAESCFKALQGHRGVFPAVLWVMEEKPAFTSLSEEGSKEAAAAPAPRIASLQPSPCTTNTPAPCTPFKIKVTNWDYIMFSSFENLYIIKFSSDFPKSEYNGPTLPLINFPSIDHLKSYFIS